MGRLMGRLMGRVGAVAAVRLAAVLAAVLVLVGPAAGLSPVPEGLDRHPVQARLVADVDAAAPGSSFTAAVVLDMAPHWHTYWRFSGDAGLPTQVDWRLPAGVAAGPLAWPAPRRYTEGGDLTVFGYAEQTALLTEIRVPAAGAPADSLGLTAEVSWLVCAELCIPGDTTLTLTLPAAPAVGPGAAHRELIEGYRARLPRAWTAADPVAWTPETRRADDGLAVAVRVEARHAAAGAAAAALPDFYPHPLDFGGGEETAYIDADGRRGEGPRVAVSPLTVVPYGDAPPPDSLSGVVVYGDAEGRTQARRVAFALVPASPVVDLRAADFTGGAAGDTGLGLYLLMALVGGLILNLMPCVLPVISLKVMSLLSQAGESPARIRTLGLAFTAGIVAAFLALAAAVVVLKAGGEQIGWGFQFQAPGFVLFLTGLVFVLGLSLFGVVTIRLPGTAGSFGGHGDGEGAGASFFNGVLATVLATPCTAPFLGAALGFAFTQPAATIFAIFAATGVGMGLPYLALAWQPGWLRFLPKPGAWMERFKQGMGFLLMATVLWLLWVLGKQLGMEAVVWTGAFLLCLALGAWLLGTWLDLGSSPRRRAVVWSLALGLAAAGYGLFLHPLLTTPVGAERPQAAVTEGWEPFTVDGLEAHLGAGRTVFVDFTAEWCWTCKVNERTVLATDGVQAAFAAHDVVLVKADWTSRNPEITRLLSAFGRSGVPLYVVFPGGAPEAPIVLPEVITPGLVVDAVEHAASL